MTQGTIAHASTKDEAAASLNAAIEESGRNNCERSLEILDSLINGDKFSIFSNENKVITYELGVMCALNVSRNDLAYSYAVKGTGFDEATVRLLRIRLFFEISGENTETAVHLVQRMASSYPDEINAIPIQWFFRLNRKLERSGLEPARKDLLSIISSPNYSPVQPGFSGDYFRRDYAVILLSSGDETGAVQAVASISDASILIRISLDPRLRHLLPADFDARAAVESDLARLKEVAASHPESADVIRTITKRLRALGRAEEALALLESARPEVFSGDTYVNFGENRNWWWDTLAQVYAVLGRYEDTVLAFRAGVDAGEAGNMNVSQTLNLAAFQVHSGRDADALKNFETFDIENDAVSPLGQMVARLVRGCAKFRTGDFVSAKTDLEYALAHEQDGPGQLVDLLLCMGNMDQAASAMIRRLDDPNQRVDALLDLSNFNPPLHPVTTDPTDGPLADLKKRPDIQAAISRAGGIGHFNLQKNGI